MVGVGARGGGGRSSEFPAKEFDVFMWHYIVNIIFLMLYSLLKLFFLMLDSANW